MCIRDRHTLYDKLEASKQAQRCEQLNMQLQGNTDRGDLGMYINVEPHEEQAGWKTDEMELNHEKSHPTL